MVLCPADRQCLSYKPGLSAAPTSPTIAPTAHTAAPTNPAVATLVLLFLLHLLLLIIQLILLLLPLLATPIPTYTVSQLAPKAPTTFNCCSYTATLTISKIIFVNGAVGRWLDAVICWPP